MKSRYDFMKESESSFDEVINDTYPDPLSLDYLKFNISSGQTPIECSINLSNIQRLWKIPLKLYGSAEYDDIVLTLNGVEHKNFVNVGDKLYFPVEEDIESSFDLTNDK